MIWWFWLLVGMVSLMVVCPFMLISVICMFWFCVLFVWHCMVKMSCCQCVFMVGADGVVYPIGSVEIWRQ